MNKQWNKDGLTRKKLENDFRIHEPFQVLEKISPIYWLVPFRNHPFYIITNP